MLSELSTVGQWYQNETAEGWYFDEITFDDETKNAFEHLNLNIKVYDHSARINIEGNSNHTYVPGHYFLYALKVQPLVILLRKYMDVFDELKLKFSNPENLAKLICSSSPSHPITDVLDAYSKTNFYQVFNNENKRLKGKNIINGSGPSISLRTSEDFIRSIILKALPVPDASSGMLGRIIYSFSLCPEALLILEKKYYSWIPYLFKCISGDELIFRILSVLGWKGELEQLFEFVDSGVDNLDWGNIKDAFKLSGTKIPSNIHYFDEPIHYSPTRGKYIHIRKGLLDNNEKIQIINDNLSSLWPGLIIFKENSEFLFKSPTKQSYSTARKIGGCNRIIYGAPGTGKSFSIEQNVTEKLIIRTVFHSETQYSDFVGCLKPVMEGDRVAYRFRPGAFTKALVKAVKNPSENYNLVIEEINRAPAAAVFGEIFQLLDRKPDGSSCYQIDISDPDLLGYLQKHTGNYFSDGKLWIPSNLSLLATMNSSDQAVMPLDTAFKRRWSFEYVQLNFNDAPNQVLELQTNGGLFKITWADFADNVLNHMLKEFRVPEDRMIGPFFINEIELKNWQAALREKLFVYLWDDVLRHKPQDRARLFSSKFATFGELYNSFPKAQVFSIEVDSLIKRFGLAVENQDG
ncbi:MULTISPECIES: AAA family ATPase [Providencia]|uniref:AAA family ATPase n=1 Tax=Providencia TaxID=586 RepID=UPI001448977A|nr:MULTISPECIES: AAA family ATPase [Providencia]MBI6194028.1 AAA family ATPase [Providencia rettgeri]